MPKKLHVMLEHTVCKQEMLFFKYEGVRSDTASCPRSPIWMEEVVQLDEKGKLLETHQHKY